MSDETSKSWFCVFNNPEEHGYIGEQQEICDKLMNEWIEENPTKKSCAIMYCVSADGLKHVHMVLEDTKTMRFSMIKKSYAVGMHFEPTKGTKEQAEDYINKRGKWEEKGEIVVCSARHGEIKGNQGARRDFDKIEELINMGNTPNQIFEQDFSFRRYEKMIREAYYYNRIKNTKNKREINVVWHIGKSGTGKSFCQLQLMQKYGDDGVYLMTDYDGGGLDKYNGEPVLFMDEFRGQIKYNQLLIMLDGYKSQIHARYTNVYALWNEVHITSVLPPETVYNAMVEYNRIDDGIEQLNRRISSIVYHWKNEKGQYKQFALSMKEYKNYNQLKQLAFSSEYQSDDFIDITDNESLTVNKISQILECVNKE